MINSDFLATYSNLITEELSYTLNAGGNAMYQRTYYYSAYTINGLVVPGEYSIENSEECNIVNYGNLGYPIN